MTVVYGRTFPDDASDLTIELSCYRHRCTKIEDGLGPHKHLERAIKLIYDEQIFTWCKWTYQSVKDWCYNPKLFWVGCGASGKSTRAAMFTYMDFASAPECTTSLLYSTTKEMLKQRIWKEIVRFYLAWHPPEFIYRKSDISITLGEEDTINGIVGNAIFRDDGTLAVNNLIGRHNKRVRVIVDELQGCPKAVIKTTANARLGTSDFLLLGMGNPENREDCLGDQTEPDTGWESITVDTGTWKTKRRGFVRHFDSFKSPALDDPVKFHYYTNREDIQSIKDDFGEDSPEWWSQIRGFIKVSGLRDAFLDYPTIDMFEMKKKILWVTKPKTIAGLDPAFSSGGDRIILQFMDVGYALSGQRTIQMEDRVQIKVELSLGEPFNFQVAKRVKAECKARGVTANNFGMDCTGAQNALADIIETEWASGIYRVNFNGNASTNPVSTKDYSRPANQAYHNRVTELWAMMTNFSQAGMIKGLDNEQIKEFISRKSKYHARRRQAEPKKDMKSRIGYSPDIADATVVGLAVVKERLKIAPMGRSSPSPDNPVWRDWQKRLEQNQVVESYGTAH